MSNLTLFSVQAVLILDGDGKRILAKYWNSPELSTFKEQKAFEKKLFDKTKRGGDIVLYDGHVVVFKNNLDVWMYIIGSPSENDLLLGIILDTIYDSISNLLAQVDKRSLLESMDAVLMVLDESLDDGILLESDVDAISQRCMRRPQDGTSDTIQLTEQSISQALQNARENVIRSLRA